MTTTDETESQVESTAYSTLGEDEGEGFLEDEEALDEEEEEDFIRLAHGGPVVPLSSRLRRDTGISAMPEGDDASEGELGIEREQEELLDGFREDEKEDNLEETRDRPTEAQPLDGAGMEVTALLDRRYV